MDLTYVLVVLSCLRVGSSLVLEIVRVLQYDLEEEGHVVYRSWCPKCVMGRGREQPHLRKPLREGSVPVIYTDYCFLTEKGERMKEEDS